MRVLLIAHLLRVRNFQPLGLEYLSASLRQAGHEVRLADATLPRQVFAAVRGWQPRLIGYHALTGSHLPLLELNRRLKDRFDFLSVFGGPHPTYFPEMVEAGGVDTVCRGEAEEAFRELVDTLQAGGEISGTRNFWVRRNGEVSRNPPRPLVQDLDTLPLPDWSLSDALPYCRRFPVRSFMASRGCPFNCSFCYNPNFRRLYEGQRSYRRRKPEAVVEEVARCHEQRPFGLAYLFDDTFGIDRDWVAAFCAAYRRRLRLPFFVQLRADLITEETLAELVRSGLASTGIGVETGSERIRATVLNKSIPDGRLLEAARLLRKHRVPFITYNILGIPETSLEDDLETLRFNRRLGPTFAESCMFQPFPRTVLGEQAAALGHFSGDPDKIPQTLKRRSPIRLSEAAQRVRLLHLFSLLVAFPVDEPRLRLLLRLPLGTLYRLASRVYDGATKTRKIFRVRVPPTLWVRALWHYLRF